MNLARFNSFGTLHDRINALDCKQGYNPLVDSVLTGIDELLDLGGSDDVIEVMARSLISAVRKDDAQMVAELVDQFVVILRHNPEQADQTDEAQVDDESVPSEIFDFLRELKDELGSSFGPVLKDLAPLLIAASKFTSAGRVVTVLELLIGAKSGKDESASKDAASDDPLTFLRDVVTNVGSGRLFGVTPEADITDCALVRAMADQYEHALINDVDGRISVAELTDMIIRLAVAYQPETDHGKSLSDSLVTMLSTESARLIEEASKTGIKARHALQLVHKLRLILA